MTLDDLKRPISTLAEKMRFTEPTRNKKAVLSQGVPRDTAVNFDTYRSLITAASRGFYCNCTLIRFGIIEHIRH